MHYMVSELIIVTCHLGSNIGVFTYLIEVKLIWGNYFQMKILSLLKVDSSQLITSLPKYLHQRQPKLKLEVFQPIECLQWPL